MSDQTASILRSVSGQFWNNDAGHPAPDNGVRVMLGFPAFPANAHHDSAAENIKYAAPGVDAGLNCDFVDAINLNFEAHLSAGSRTATDWAIHGDQNWSPKP